MATPAIVSTVLPLRLNRFFKASLEKFIMSS
jgi:uncharacterized sodium:solute symporter family permease YidK